MVIWIKQFHLGFLNKINSEKNFVNLIDFSSFTIVSHFHGKLYLYVLLFVMVIKFISVIVLVLLTLTLYKERVFFLTGIALGE